MIAARRQQCGQAAAVRGTRPTARRRRWTAWVRHVLDVSGPAAEMVVMPGAGIKPIEAV
jgi:hypothetical protein